MPNLPGQQITTNLPPLPGVNAPAPSPYPAWWDNTQAVLDRVFTIAEHDPQSAAEMWRTYKQLTGK